MLVEFRDRFCMPQPLNLKIPKPQETPKPQTTETPKLSQTISRQNKHTKPPKAPHIEIRKRTKNIKEAVKNPKT